MKTKIRSIFMVIVTLGLSICLLTACGSKPEDITGPWDNDDILMSLTLNEDGTALMEDFWTSYDLTYEWDGETLVLSLSEAEELARGTLDETGHLVLEDVDGYFYRVESAGFVRSETLELENTAWELDDGSVYHFYSEGIFASSDGMLGTYTWDGMIGDITVDDVTAIILYDEDGFFIEGEDTYFYPFYYYGDADPALLEAESMELAGTAWELVDYDIVYHFYDDGTYATDQGGSGTYEWDGHAGSLTGGGATAELLNDLDGFFFGDFEGGYAPFAYYGDADPSLVEADTDDTSAESSTPAKDHPAGTSSGGAWSDAGDYGDAYYWYDADGDLWYWDGYEDHFIAFGDDYYGDTGDYGDAYYWYDDDGDLWYWDGYEDHFIGSDYYYDDYYYDYYYDDYYYDDYYYDYYYDDYYYDDYYWSGDYGDTYDYYYYDYYYDDYYYYY